MERADKIVVRLGEDVLTDDPGQPVSRPLKSPDNFDWNSEYGLLVRGTDLGKAEKLQRSGGVPYEGA